MKTIFIYTTWPSTKEAKAAALVLVESKLVACANIMPEHESIYSWQGQVQNEKEVSMILKTTEELFTPVKEKIQDLHSYDCPCILGLPVTAGQDAFLNWVNEQTLNPTI